MKTKSMTASCLLLAVTMFAAACSTSSADGEDGADGAVGSDGADADASEVVAESWPQPDENTSGEILVWASESFVNSFEHNVPAFNEAHPEIEVTFRSQSQRETNRNVRLSLSAGTGGPDVAVIEDSVLQQFVQLQGLSDMTELVEPHLENINDYKAGLVESDGRYFGFPWEGGPVMIYYRQDLFEEAGIDPEAIETWDDYYAAAVQLKERTGVAIAADGMATNDARTFEKFLWQQGLGYVDDSGDVAVDSPGAVRALEFMGRLWDEELVLDRQQYEDGWTSAANSGEFATVIGAAWVGRVLDLFWAPDTSGLWRAMPLPVWEEGGARTANDGGSALVIPEQSEQKEAARAFVEFMLTRTESHVNIWEKETRWTAWEPTYDDPAISAPVEFFGGQPVGELYAELAQEIPEAGIYGVDYPEMNEIMAAEIQSFTLGDQTAEEAVTNAAHLMRQYTGRS